MTYKNILITGGAGFVGSNIAVFLKDRFFGIKITALDNLSRRGSDLTLPRLARAHINFIHGDIRMLQDLENQTPDLIIDCSAEPSVLAGVNSSPRYVTDTNLSGSLNCFELARKSKADIIFLSTSRVYPMDYINSLPFSETPSRFSLKSGKLPAGVSVKGISETFPLTGIRSLYGSTKLASEIILAEYADMYGIRYVINRLGVIAGPWQMGKIDQGIVAFWLYFHMTQRPLKYIGFGGSGKQVRDILHIDDLGDLIGMEMKHIKKINGQVFNAGGGESNSVSLKELTVMCQRVCRKKTEIGKTNPDRINDIKWYITDNTKVTKLTGWKPVRRIEQTVGDTFNWININKNYLDAIFPYMHPKL